MSSAKQHESQQSQSRSILLPTKTALSPSIDVPPTAKGPTLGSNSIRRRLLVVDDDPQVAALVVKLGARIGCLCTSASDALDALFHLNQTHHDVVITDFDMPYMDGIQLADQIKFRHGQTKVIIMTGQCEALIKERMSRCTSVHGLLFKPFKLDDMRAMIEEVFGSQYSVVSPEPLAGSAENLSKM